MNILFIINNINRGGAETLLLNKINGLQKTDPSLDISVLILEDKQALRPLYDSYAITVELLDILHKPYWRQIAETYSYIKKNRPDVVHTHLMKSDRIGLPAAFLAGVSNRISTVHSMEDDTRRKDKYTRWVVSRFGTHIIAVSDSVRERSIVKYNHPPQKMITIFNSPGFNTYQKSPRKKRSSEIFQMVQVGRLTEPKGQKFLLAAMKILQDRKQPVELTIYGDGKLRTELEGQIFTLKLKNVTLYGISSKISEKLEKADCFVSSSLWEGLPMALVEALSVGLPVVATDIAPHREILCQFREYPCLVSPKDASALADTMQNIVNLPGNTYQSLSEEMLQLSKRYTIDNMVHAYHSLYTGLE